MQTYQSKDDLSLDFFLRFQFWNNGVSVYGPDGFKPVIDTVKKSDYYIPNGRVEEEHQADDSKIVLRNRDVTDLRWNQETSTLEMLVSEEYSESVDRELAYHALLVSEYDRQRNGKVLTNGCGTISPEGEGVLILGKRGYGKTGTAMVLGQQHNHRLVASDQVVFGTDEDDNLRLIGGDKYTKVRRGFVEDYFPSFVDDLPDGTFWDDKITVSEEDLPIETASSSSSLDAAVFVNIDYQEDDYIRVQDASEDLKMSLFLSEQFGRYISGICTPYLDSRDNIVTLSPSLDNRELQRNREELIERLYEVPLKKIESGSFELVSQYIEDNLKN